METILKPKNELPDVAADLLAQTINDSLRVHNQCVLALSGGSSPAQMLKSLAFKNVDWQKVKIILVDERFTDNKIDQNQTMIHSFIQGIPGNHPFFQNLLIHPDFNQNLKMCNKFADRLQQANIVVLGMGLDGHTASLFPDADEYESAMKSTDKYVAVHPQSAPHPRISMSYSWITQADQVMLYIPGKEKHDCFNEILTSNQSRSPIKSLTEDTHKKLTLFSSED